eukprot:1151993-Pelagomonas_calceolata.AAC.2
MHMQLSKSSISCGFHAKASSRQKTRAGSTDRRHLTSAPTKVTALFILKLHAGQQCTANFRASGLACICRQWPSGMFVSPHGGRVIQLPLSLEVSAGDGLKLATTTKLAHSSCTPRPLSLSLSLTFSLSSTTFNLFSAHVPKDTHVQT